MTERPQVTRTTHPLPFKRLSPVDFERLCLWLVSREGYQSAEHFGAKGGDQGRDVVAMRDGRRVAFQCKRVERFEPAEAEDEITKLLKLPPEMQPQDIVFVVTATLTAKTRDRARAVWGNRGFCHFWAGTELDEMVKRHADILKEFFDLGVDELEQAEAEAGSLSGWVSLKRLDQDAREAVRFEIGLGGEQIGLHLPRARAATALRNMIGESPNVLVCGESGVGKSALVLEELAAVESHADKLQFFFLNLRLLPKNIPELRNAIGCAVEDSLAR